MNGKSPLKTYRHLIGIFNGIPYCVQLELKNEDILIYLYREEELVASKNLHDADLTANYAHTELVGWIAEKINIPNIDPYDLRYCIFSTLLSAIGFFQSDRRRRARKKAAMKDKEYMEFKLGIEKLTIEALEIIKRMRELEGESEKLIERKRAGEDVKDILKQNKVELKRLRNKELEVYSECKKKFRIEKARRLVLRRKAEKAIETYYRTRPLGEEASMEIISKIKQMYKMHKFGPRDLWVFLNPNTSKGDQKLLYIRTLDLLDKLRLKRLKICFLVLLIFVVPIIIFFLVIGNM